jgi:hypothetical protein
MANFFKDYHQEVKAKREAEERIKKAFETPEFNRGQLVKVREYHQSALLGGVRKMYFSDYACTKGMVLLSPSKKEALSGVGYLYYECDIIN